MSTHNARRGRPKGSGIDDTLMLEDVASLIAAHPGMKPTTAIKALGVQDPSTIRRLRDKFKTIRPDVIAASRMNSARPAASSRTTYEGSTSISEPRAMALDTGRDHTLREPVNPRAPDNAKTTVASASPAGRAANDGANDNTVPRVVCRPGETTAANQLATSPHHEAKPHPIAQRPSARPSPRRLDFDIPAPTDLPDDLAPSFVAALEAWQGGLTVFKELQNAQIAATKQWVNSPGVQMVLRQQLLAARMMLSCMPPRGSFQTAAVAMMGGFAPQPTR